MIDIFFRKDNFRNEPWYDELNIFCAIGVCQPENEEHLTALREALAILGYETKTISKDGKNYIVGC